MLPNFFVVGAQKSGTTSLHHYLNAHPEVYLPIQKETKFFVHDRFYNKGLGYYETEYFSKWNQELAVGEIDPEYMYFEPALERIAKHFDLNYIRFIFLLRNPIDRAYSHYLMTYRRGLETLTFEEAIAAEQERIAEGHMENLRYSYISRGFYLRQIERFLAHVDRSRMLFLLAENFKADTLGCLQTVFDFLGVSRNFVPPNIDEEFHSATVPRSMNLLHRIKGQGLEKKFIRLLIPWKMPRDLLRVKLLEINQTRNYNMILSNQTRQQLIEVFRQENDRLARFLDRDLSCWNSGIEIGR